ncbi:hypothetical protein OSTOST_05238 [Ostertagia ostertagi]
MVMEWVVRIGETCEESEEQSVVRQSFPTYLRKWRGSRQVLKRVYVKRGSHWVLKKVVVRSNPSPLANFRNGQSVSTRQPEQEQNGSQSDHGNIFEESQKIVELVVDPDKKPDSPAFETDRDLVKPPPMQQSSKIARVSELIRKGNLSTVVTKSQESQAGKEPTCLICGKTKPPLDVGGRIDWLCCSNVAKCRARAHEQCLRGARLRCFVCHTGSWTVSKDYDVADAQSLFEEQEVKSVPLILQK